MKNENYMGWSNRETWGAFVNLSSTYEFAKELESVGAHISGAYTPGERNLAIAEFAEYLQDFLDELRMRRGDSVELVRLFDEIGSYWRIDFHELAEAWLE